MANRRMFSKNVARTDTFLDLEPTAQNLYFHFGIEADDDGFFSPKMVMRIIGASKDDFNALVKAELLIAFEDGVCVIRHWRVNNEIRRDRYKETQYLEHKQKLVVNKGVYDLVVPTVVPNGDKVDTQDRIGKDSNNNLESNTSIKSNINNTAQRKKRSASPSKEKEPKTPPKDQRAKDDEPMNLEQYVEKMLASPQKHIRIIGEFASEKRPAFTTAGQWREFTSRHLRVANRMAKFTEDQIGKAFDRMQKDIRTERNPKGFITKWGLDTVEKYLVEVK